MNRLEDAARWACELRITDIPEDVLEIARHQYLSVLGAVFAGARNQSSARAVKAAEMLGAGGDASCLALGIRASLASALISNVSLSMALDYDDYLFLGHTGHSAVVVPLTVGEYLGSGGKDALKATVIANEIGGRLGASVVLGPHNGQMWTYMHSLSSAAATASLLRLDAERFAAGMAISIAQPVYPLFLGFLGQECKTVCASFPVLNGVFSAFLASEGMSGPLSVLDGPGGLWERFTYVPLPLFMTGLGEAWVTRTLSFKAYPGCAYTNACAEASLAILDEFAGEKSRKLETMEIEKIRVKANILTLAMEAATDRFSDYSSLCPAGINFSVGRTIALALTSGKLSGDEFAQDFISRNQETILKIASKVTVEHDPELTLELVRGLDEGIDLKGVARALSPLDIPALLRAFRSQFRTHRLPGSIEAGSLARAISVRDLRRLSSVLSSLVTPGGAPYTLKDENLRRMRFPFGAEVTISLKDGSRYGCRISLQKGSCGLHSGRLSVAGEKFRGESERFLGAEGVRKVIEIISNIEKHEVAELTLSLYPQEGLSY